ncbi:DUF3144 domain-containing protein [Shewanella sp. C32]|uniref:DUF3144 domain-containing protein n=1 Tax=Shewanella electrica TaxID=515560 RepID=A0ABT2FHJ6_9GAMM|nr:DUF3144 domain-containing protein [Shewanella electrica]MCH1923904.1 DUF3144 domain-containing protein [Shewanella electrica]MCS4555807.1 DUF3144 domain-containing protein [Shewanella electrica]
MTDAKKDTTIFELADQFIALANELSQTEQDVGKVGTALRFAAARYNAFEAAIKSSDLAKEKDSALEWFSNEYREMLQDNLQDHIANPPQAPANDSASDDNGVQQFQP